MLKSLIKFWLENIASPNAILKTINAAYPLPIFDTSIQQKNTYLSQLNQGLLNSKYIPKHLNRMWPRWVHKQFQPTSDFFKLPRSSFDFLNKTDRNWTTLSLPGHDDACIVDQTGMITPIKHNWSIECWIASGSQLISPAVIQNVSQSFNADLPTLMTEFTIEGLKVSSECFMTSLPKSENLLLNEYTLKNTSSKTLKFSFFVALRPYGPEGITSINNITYLSNNAFIVNNNLGLILDKKPDNIVCLAFEDGDISDHFNEWDMILKSNCPEGLASAFAEYTIMLEPQESTSIAIKIPTKLQRYGSNLSKSKTEKLMTRCSQLQSIRFTSEKSHLSPHWSAYKDHFAHILLPDPTLTQQLSTSMTHLVGFLDNEALKTEAPLFQDIRPIITALNHIGASEASWTILNTRLIRKKWYEITTDTMTSPPELGHMLEALSHTLLIHPNPNFAEKYVATIDSIVDFIVQHRDRKPKKSSPFRGLLKQATPATLSGTKNYYVADNIWALHAIQVCISLAKQAKKDDLATRFKGRYHQIFSALEFMLQHVEEKEAFKPILPITPKEFHDARLTVNLAAISPLSIFEPQDKRITNTLAEIESRCTHNDLIYSLHHPLGIDTLKSIHLAHAYITRRDQKAIKCIEALSGLLTNTHTLAPATHPKEHHATDGPGHSALITAEWISLIRHMIIEDTETTLHLTPMIPKTWLNSKLSIVLKHCPTKFGPLALTMTFNEGEVNVNIDANFHTKPKLFIHLPVSITDLEIDGKKLRQDSTSVLLPDLLKSFKLFHN